MYRGRSVVVALCLALGTVSARAQGEWSVDTLNFWSQALGVRKRALVLLPPSYRQALDRRYSVALYLHGYSGNEGNWLARGDLAATAARERAATGRELIVVMPDGDDSWYTTWNTLGDYPRCRREFVARPGDTADSYCVPWPHYDDYIARDVVRAVDSTYRTKASAATRGIAGLSMGGYGAIALALRYPDVFGAAASHSGTVSPMFRGAFAKTGAPQYADSVDELGRVWQANLFASLLPAFGRDTIAWAARDPARLAAALHTHAPALFLDVGVDDVFLGQNRALHWELERMQIAHEYHEWPGGHSWTYWAQHAVESFAWLARRLTP